MNHRRIKAKLRMYPKKIRVEDRRWHILAYMRQGALELLKEGKTKTEVSKMLGVGRTSLLRWEQRE